MKIHIYIYLWCSTLSLVLAESVGTEVLRQLSFQSPSNIIPLSPANISILDVDADYYSMVLLTSSDESMNCQACLTARELLGHIAEIWFRKYGDSNKIFFFEFDLIDKSNFKTFQALNISTAPNMWLYPPYEDTSFDEEDKFKVLKAPHYRFMLPMSSREEQLNHLAKFISETTNIDIQLKDEDPFRKFLVSFTLTLSAIIFIKKRGPTVITNASKKSVYMILSILLILACVGGYSFSTVVGVPFVAKNDKNEIIMISGGIHYQFGIEIIIVGSVYTLCALALVWLISLGKDPYKKWDSPRKNAFLTILTSAILFIFYSCLTSMFLRKDSSYPYHFLKLF